MHNCSHVLVDLVSHGLSGYCSRIHQVVLDPDHVSVSVSACIVEYTLECSHVLACYVLVHDDDLSSPVFDLSPHLVDYVLVSAVGVSSHYHTLVQSCEVHKSFFLVLCLENLGEVQGFHLYQDVDTPAVSKPVTEVSIVVSRA